MGFINFCIITLAQGCVIIALILFIPGLPPDNMEFSAYSVKPTLGLDGLLSINTKLNNAERLFENYIKGPEGLAIFNGEIYTGIRGGKIIKFKNDEIRPVLQFGDTCENLLEEEKCGRILGISIHKDGTLYAVDGYYGVFKANLSSGAFENVVTKDEIIEGKPVKFPNAIDVGHDGSIYWTLSSTSHEIHDGLFAILGDGNGRLIKTNPKKKTHEVLIDNLHFANGVVLSQDESFVLVSETAAARVTRYYLKGPKKGQVDVFIDGLPGLPDNLKRDSKGGFYIPLVRSVGEDEPHLPFTLANYPLIRKFIVRTASLIELCIQFLNDLYPTRFFKFSIKFIGNLESVLSFSRSKRVTIVRTNSNGDITESLHSTDGSLAMISDVAYLNGAYYFGSPHNNYLGKVVMAES